MPDLESTDPGASVYAGDDPTVVKKALDLIKESKPIWSKWRDKALEARKFYSGDQWDAADQAVLRENNRIPIIFNFTKKYINVLTGSEIHNRQEVKFVPRKADASTDVTAMGELETATYDWVIECCNGSEERTQAFKDLLITGMGWTEVFVDEEIDKDIRIVLRKVDGLEMMWDGRAKMQNLEDARWIARSKWVPLDVAINMWPKHEELIRSMSETVEPAQELSEMPDEVRLSSPLLYKKDNEIIIPGEQGSRKGQVMVTQFQYYELEKRYQVIDPTDVAPSPAPPQAPPMPPMPPQGPQGMQGPPQGAPPMQGMPPQGMQPPMPPQPPAPPPPPPVPQAREMSESDFKKLQKRLDSLDMPMPDYAFKTRKVFKEIFIIGMQAGLAEAEELPVQAGGFTLKCVTGEWDDTDKLHRGLLYSMMDPQRFINKYISQTAYIIACNPKGAMIAEATALKDPQRVEAEISKPDSIILANKNAVAEKRIMFTGAPTMPQATYEMAKFSIEALGGITGINPELLGATTGDQPAITGRQRQRQGMTIHAEYFSAFTRYRRMEARTVLEYIREFIPDGTLIRIGGPFSQQMVPLFKKKMLGASEYDIVTDEAVRSPDAKAEVWTSLQPVLPVLVRGGLVVPELIDLVPSLPASIAAKLKQRMQQTGGIPPQQGRGGQQKLPPDPQEVQAKVQKLQADVQLAQAKIQEVLARARMLDETTKLKKIQLMGDQALKQQKQQSDEQHNQSKLIADSLKRNVRPERG